MNDVECAGVTRLPKGARRTGIRRGLPLTLALALGCAACSKPPAEASAKSGASTTAPSTPAATPAVAAPALPEPVRKLLGRWVRSDGGYTLELRSADLSGVVDAGYFNPKSIHVSRAVWMQGGGGFQVAVELNDVGYPGATYLLTYDAQNDRLAGKYTQPAMQQSFDIEFARQPK
jgi:hypothetical protein